MAAGESGKPSWCWYNNDPKNGPKYGRLYNWYAVNDPRGLAPAGWTLPADGDWTKMMFYLGGQQMAGKKLKSDSGWIDGNIGTNESGFNGLPGGYRVENGNFPQYRQHRHMVECDRKQGPDRSRLLSFTKRQSGQEQQSQTTWRISQMH